MRRAILALVLVTACDTRPMQLTTALPSSAPRAYSCAMDKVSRLGYTVYDGDSAISFLEAVRETHHVIIPVFGGNIRRDVLTISMIKANGMPALRVIASSDRQAFFLSKMLLQQRPTTRQVQADAGDVLTTCAGTAQ